MRNLDDEIVFLFSLESQQQSQQLDDFSIEAKNDKLRYLEEVYTAQRKVGDLQTSLKVLESKLAEKDSEIRMLQDKKSNASSSPARTRLTAPAFQCAVHRSTRTTATASAIRRATRRPTRSTRTAIRRRTASRT